MTGLMEVLNQARANDSAEEADCLAMLLNGFRRCRKRLTGSDDLSGEDLMRFAQIVELNMGEIPATARTYAPKAPQRSPLIAHPQGGSILARNAASLRSASAVPSGSVVTPDMMETLEQSLQGARAASG